ncbi:hypothetical protein D3C85_1261000 [compost metagenome]
MQPSPGTVIREVRCQDWRAVRQTAARAVRRRWHAPAPHAVADRRIIRPVFVRRNHVSQHGRAPATRDLRTPGAGGCAFSRETPRFVPPSCAATERNPGRPCRCRGLPAPKTSPLLRPVVHQRRFLPQPVALTRRAIAEAYFSRSLTDRAARLRYPHQCADRCDLIRCSHQRRTTRR